MIKKNVIFAVVGVILFISGFYSGTKFVDSKQPNFVDKNIMSGQFNTQNNALGSKTNALGGGVNGEILLKDENTITLKLRDGNSKIIFYSEKTTISKMASSTSEGLMVGDQATISGSSNSDGSINADSIQVRQF